VWASTACLYIEGHDPDQQLSKLLEKQPESHPAGPFNWTGYTRPVYDLPDHGMTLHSLWTAAAYWV
jgi:hypothetical protein